VITELNNLKFEIMLEQLDFELVRERYDTRLNVHQLIRRDFDSRVIDNYVLLALGITEMHGNFSAHEHGLGPEVLRGNPEATIYRRVFDLATELNGCTVTHVPRIIYSKDISYLKISVGSEMGMMLRPNVIWVGNVRTYWVHFLIENDWDVDAANVVLESYENDERNAEMDYRVWRELYVAAGRSLQILGDAGSIEARNQDVEPGEQKFLWADAITTSLYEIRNQLE
jgi:hypothetical protein